MKRLAASALIAAAVPSTVAQAHPHIFVSVEVAVTYENNRPTAVELAWIYDDYFSLLLLTDLGLDLLITPANLDAAYTLVEELLYGRPATGDGADDYFPEVGEAFADTIEITCASSG